MTVLWLIVWLWNGTPGVTVVSSWNNWGIALAVCLLADIVRNN